jgi:hypothetical protein
MCSAGQTELLSGPSKSPAVRPGLELASSPASKRERLESDRWDGGPHTEGGSQPCKIGPNSEFAAHGVMYNHPKILTKKNGTPWGPIGVGVSSACFVSVGQETSVFNRLQRTCVSMSAAAAHQNKCLRWAAPYPVKPGRAIPARLPLRVGPSQPDNPEPMVIRL